MVTATEDLEGRMIEFIRAFGLHQPDRTPCGVELTISEAHALTDLRDRSSVSQRDLTGSLGLDKSTVSRLVAQLESRGWVRRDVAEDDGRRWVVTLTDKGERVAERLARARAQRMAALLTHIPEDERAGVVHALELLVEASRALD